MAQGPPFLDMLAWFDEDERNTCSSCGERACISLADLPTHFCLACGAVTVRGERLDIDRRIPLDL